MINSNSSKFLKEWSAIVEALGKGLQAILLRKYLPTHREFFLYPTYNYVKKDVLSKFQSRYHDHVKETSKKPGEGIPISYYASVVEAVRVEDPLKLRKLTQYYIWSPEHVESYFLAEKPTAAYIWFVKVYRLPKPKLTKPVERAMTYGYFPEPIPTVGAAPVLSEEQIDSILKDVKKLLGSPDLEVIAPEGIVEEPGHDEVRDMLLEIGKIEGKVVEKEYPIDNYRLDVVWKRIRAGNPSFVFEVQFGGNFFEALTKLKHAWDMWNSQPFLVTTPKYAAKAKELLEGSFHEMGHVAKIIDWQKIIELYKLEVEASKIRVEIGI